MADQDIATALSAVTINMRPNFPLPRELRDQIYGYLLDSNYTRITRPCDYDQIERLVDEGTAGPKAYRFHTNIMAVNRVIHDEAEDLLYKNNIFVVFSYQWPQFNNVPSGGLLWIPTVSETYVARVKHHSLRIHMTAAGDDLRSWAAEKGTSTPLRSVLFLAKDLQAFCHAVHQQVGGSTGPGVAISTNSGFVGPPEVTFNGIKHIRPQLRCEFRDTSFRTINAELQHLMLAHFDGIIGPGQRVSFTGKIWDSQQTVQLKKVMAPSVFCRHAIFWNAYKQSCTGKVIADVAIGHDGFDIVIGHYKTLMSGLVRLVDDAAELQWALQNVPEAVEACDLLKLELLVQMSCGYLKMGMLDLFVHYSRQLTNLHGSCLWRVPADLDAYIDLIVLWRSLYAPCPPGALPVQNSVAFFARPLALCQRDAHHDHDLEILMRVPDQEVTLTLEHLPLHKCSINHLPFPRTSFYKAREKPKSIKGWVDVDYLRSLEDVHKRKITGRQRAYGLQVTDFDDL